MDQTFGLLTQLYEFGSESIQLVVPDPEQVKLAYRVTNGNDKPYWTAVWPSAEAICRFLVEHPWLVSGREVWEPGAGLALPSMLAARYASLVRCSDIYQPAVDCMQASAILNGAVNIIAERADWNQLPPITAEVVLLSDVHYEPGEFESVFQMIQGFLDAGASIILGSPARITSSVFYDRIKGNVKKQVEYQVRLTTVSVLVLSR
ncbi:MAG: hypothetical protein ABWZ25_04355 [Chitinophagaceae bacterium]